MKKYGIALSPLFLCFLGCHEAQLKCKPEVGDYMVQVHINGEASSFEGRRIEVNGVLAKERIECIAKDNNGCIEYGVLPGYSLGFCTTDRETFLHKRLDLVVYEGETVVSTLSYERTKCLDSVDGNTPKGQDNHFFLTPEGIIKEDSTSHHICDGYPCGTMTCAEAREQLSPL